MSPLLLISSIFLSQFLVLSLCFDLERILLVGLAIVVGTILGVVCYVLYTEITLFIENLSKIDVTDKAVLITGCDSGFGLMLSESLVKKGMFVFACVLSMDSVGAQNLKSLSYVKVIKMDVTIDQDVKSSLAIVEQYISNTKMILWAVVNNAGLGYSRFLEFTSIDKVRQLLEVNALGMLRVCQIFVPLLRGHGRIVNVTSLAGIHVSPFLGAYCASKFAAEALSKILRIEMFPLGIPVITLQPNAYKTPILTSVEKIYGIEETKLYGINFVNTCQEVITKWVLNSSENFQEVICSLENAILNKKFQYTYHPNFRFRLNILLLKLISDNHYVTTGCRDTDLWIPTKIE